MVTRTESKDKSVSKHKVDSDVSGKSPESRASLEEEKGVADEGSDDSETDEEELLDMLLTLQKVYNEVCSPSSRSPKTSQSPLDSPPKNVSRESRKAASSSSLAFEDWQESDGEAPPSSNNSSGRGTSGCGSSSDGDVFDRLEMTRIALEDAMGVAKLLTAYDIIQVRASPKLIQ